jgi:TfoX/Sxy family transcriptional regulator of competence genes
LAYSEDLADRVRQAIAVHPGVSERKMFGGVTWMLGGNMACGIIADDLMVRLGVEDARLAVAEPHVGPMEFTGRPMSGFVVVGREALSEDEVLTEWVDAAVTFAATLPSK